MFSDTVTSSCVGAGSSLPRPSNISLKTGTMKTSMRITATNDIRQHHDGVGHRRLDRRSELRLFLVVHGERLEGPLEESAGLARADHVDHERREVDRMLRERVRQRSAVLDIDRDLLQDAAELLVLGLRRQDRQRAQQRETGTDHGGHLSAHDREILEADAALEPGDRDLALQAGARLRLLDRDRQQAETANLGESSGFARCLELALDDLARVVAARVGEVLDGDRHVSSSSRFQASGTRAGSKVRSDGPASSRRMRRSSESGSCAFSKAASRVISPSLTRSARC